MIFDQTHKDLMTSYNIIGIISFEAYGKDWDGREVEWQVRRTGPKIPYTKKIIIKLRYLTVLAV